MQISNPLENFENQISALASRDKAKDRMNLAIESVLSFNDDQQTGGKYVKALFNSADAVDDYAKLQMQLVAYLEELASQMKERAREISQTEGECNEPQH